MQPEKKFQSFHQPKKKTWWPFSKKERNRTVVQRSEIVGLQHNNPYARVTKRHFKFPFKIVFISALFIGWFGLIFYLPYFRVTQISFVGLKIIKQEDIERYVRDNYLTTNQWWPKNNYFLIGQGRLTNDLNDTFSLNSVQIQKIFPNKLMVTLEEKVSSIVYDNGVEYFLLDQNGSVLKQIVLNDVVLPNSTTVHIPALKELSPAYDGYPIVYDSRHMQVLQKQTDVLNKEVIQGLLNTYNALRRNKLANVAYMTLDDPNAGITIHNEKPWTIIMNPLTDISSQLENIRIITKDNKPSQYVDVRFGDRVYWK